MTNLTPHPPDFPKQFVEALLTLDRVGADRILATAMAAEPGLVVAERLISVSLELIGLGWERGSVSLAQVYLTARMCEDMMTQFVPADPRAASGELAIVVLDDQHLLGARIVRSVLASAGFGLVDYGSMTATDAASRIRDEKPAIVLVSALMLRSALQVRPVIESLQRAGLITRVIVGGAPFRLDESLWKEVGAHAMGRTASDALSLVRQLTQEAS